MARDDVIAPGADDPAPADPAATLAAWRARGDDRFAPVRFHLIEAMARRAADCHGDVRRVLDERLRVLMTAYATERARAGEEAGGAPADASAVPSGFKALLAHAAQQSISVLGEPATGTTTDIADPNELKTLRHFRSTWSRLSADRRLVQSLAAVPENAGPLNSHQLVHRALTQMRELSPAYLERFMTYVDALLWIEQRNAGAAQAAAETLRAKTPRKTARGKAG